MSTYNDPIAYETSKPYNGSAVSAGGPAHVGGGTLVSAESGAKKRHTDQVTQSPWEARTKYEEEEKKRRKELEPQVAEAVVTESDADLAEKIAAITAKKPFEYIELAAAEIPETPGVLPEVRQQQIQTLALQRRSEELQQRFKYEQIQLAQKIERDAIRREEEKNAAIDVALAKLQRKMELDMQHQALLEADDAAIMRFIQELETSDA